MTIELKIQLDAIKLMDKLETYKYRYADSRDGFMYMTPSSHYVVRIPESHFWLDKRKMESVDWLAPKFNIDWSSVKELSVKHSLLNDITGKGRDFP